MWPLLESLYFRVPAWLLLALFLVWICLRLRPYIKAQSAAQKSLIDSINRLLPQTQCGRCGYAGCRPYAHAISNGDAINKCPPGGEDTIRRLAELLNETPSALDPACGEPSNAMVAVIREDECIGCTKCIVACPVDAIIGGPRLMHTVIAQECTGCDLCVEPCPVDCIDMVAAPVTAAWSRRLPGNISGTPDVPAIDSAIDRGNRLIAVAEEEFPPAQDEQRRAGIPQSVEFPNFPHAQDEQPCIRCGFCADVCPARLLPQQLYGATRAGRPELAQDYGLLDCIECGACNYVCPSHIPLVQYFRAGKQTLEDWQQRQSLGEHWRQRFEFRQYRLTKTRRESATGSSRKKSRTEDQAPVQAFSRERAREEIKAAVARVKSRRQKINVGGNDGETGE